MKNIVNFSTKNKLAVWLLTIIITFYGIYAGTQMKTETIPDISIPFLMVTGVYPGATPEKVMNEISIPLEKAAEGLENVKGVYSNSYSSVSSLQIEYEYGIDMDEAKRSLENALDNVSLPDNAQEPMITSISMNMMPIIALSVSSETEDIVELTSTIQDSVVPKIEKIDGVASANITGQHIEEIELIYNKAKMAELSLTEETVKQIVQASDMAISLGLFEFENSEEAIAVDGKLTSIELLKEVIVPITPTKNNPMPFVKLGDIAEIETIGKVESVSRTNGKDSITIQIIKEPQANTVDVANEVKDLIKELEEKNKGLTIEISLDQATPIEKSVSTMIEKALFGGLIAVLIILLFLRDFKSTIISIVSIPVSIFMALLVLSNLGITLNIMTLGAITIAIGRVIDDSIVVVENIYRRLHLKDEPFTGRQLIKEATVEMFKPILSSTLVTIAVFTPLIFVGGMVGELFVPFALTMSLALIASLIVAVTIVPALSHFLFKKKLYGEKEENKHKEVGKLAKGYKKALDWSLNHKVISLILSVVLLIGSLGLIPLIGFSFLGSDEDKVMYITYTPKAGETEEQTLTNVTKVEEKLMKHPDVEIVQLSISNDSSDIMSMMTGGGGALLYVIFDPEMKDFSKAKEQIEEDLAKLKHSGTWSNQGFSSMMSSNEVSYTFYSEDLDKLKSVVKKAEKALNESKGVKDVSSTDKESYVEYTFKVNQPKLLQYGLTTGQLVMMLMPDNSKEVLTTIEKDGNDIQVIVQQEKAQQPKSIDDILSKQVPVASGDSVPLSELIEIEKGTTLNALSRSEGAYFVTVSATITEKDVSKVTSNVNGKINNIELPKGVWLETEGVTADMIETFTQLGVAMIAAIAIVYFILVVTFGEGLAPFAILFSLPFAIIGSLVGLLIAKETISVSVMMGLLMLIGIVVTNAIVLVDRIIHMERDGMEMREAILEAGTTRLRPILMTAIATIGALLPLAIQSGGNALISKGLGITVIGGLTSSTLLTLIVVPIVYETLSKLLKKDRKNMNDN